MNQLSELVRDFKLETIALDNFETIHEHPERRPSLRLERWVQVKELGHGAFGSVRVQRRVTENQPNSQLRAVKQITVRPTEKIDYSSELEAIVKSSPQKYEACFVKCFGWYETPGSIFIAMKYLGVDDFEKYLVQSPQSKLPEQEVQLIVRQIFQGLALMHQNRFAHRDLKLKNILVKSHPPSPNGKRFRDGYRLTSVVGTPGYMAPEMWEFTERGSPYVPGIWAVGEIAYRLLTARPTFEKLRQLKSFTDQSLPFPEIPLYDTGVSSSGIKFIVSAMRPAPTERMSAQQALNNPWMQFLLPASEANSARFTSEGCSLTKASASWSSPEEQSQLGLRKDQEPTAASAQAHEAPELTNRTESGGDASTFTAIQEMSNSLSTSIITESDQRPPNISTIASEKQTISEEIVQPLHEARSTTSQKLNGSPKATPNIPADPSETDVVIRRPL
ncbi:kinase-like domain-containing protein [Aspergillus venezuelensis]